jgi:hypothetical protein
MGIPLLDKRPEQLQEAHEDLGKKGKLPGLLTTMGPSGSIVYGSVMGITFLLLP